jgi:hypothetical protein
MSNTQLTDELKQMNAYWRLLAGLVNEGLGVVVDERLSPEARLEKLRQMLEFARRYIRDLPPSVRAELDADPPVQALLANVARRSKDPQAADAADTWVIGEDGDFHEIAPDPEPGEHLRSDDQKEPVRPEGGREGRNAKS